MVAMETRRLRMRQLSNLTDSNGQIVNRCETLENDPRKTVCCGLLDGVRKLEAANAALSSGGVMTVAEARAARGAMIASGGCDPRPYKQEIAGEAGAAVTGSFCQALEHHQASGPGHKYYHVNDVCTQDDPGMFCKIHSGVGAWSDKYQEWDTLLKDKVKIKNTYPDPRRIPNEFGCVIDSTLPRCNAPGNSDWYIFPSPCFQRDKETCGLDTMCQWQGTCVDVCDSRGAPQTCEFFKTFSNCRWFPGAGQNGECKSSILLAYDQSDDVSQSTGETARLAVDENTQQNNQTACTHTAAGVGEWWRLQFPEDQTVDRVEIWNQAGGDATDLVGVEVRVDDYVCGTLDRHYIQNVDCAGARGSMVELRTTLDKPLNLCEVKPFGPVGPVTHG